MLKQIMYMHDCMFITHMFIKIKINFRMKKNRLSVKLNKKVKGTNKCLVLEMWNERHSQYYKYHICINFFKMIQVFFFLFSS